MSEQTDKKSEFLKTVFPAELDEIRNRRKNLGIDAGGLKGPPSTAMGLTGLALSGGGIRSATVSLGVIQALAKHRVLKSVDYLSTVSGGGFIGACFSSLLNSPGCSYDGDFPLRCETGVEEPRAVRHLRNSSNYLAPRGLAGALRVPTVMVRGVLINLLALLPYIMLCVLATEVLYEAGHGFDRVYRALPVAMIVLFLLLVFSFPVFTRFTTGHFTWGWRNSYEAVLTWLFSAAVLLLALVPLSWVVSRAVEESPGQFSHDLREFVLRMGSPGHLRAAAIVIVLVLALTQITRLSGAVSKFTSKLVLYVVGLLGPLGLFVVYLFLCLIQVDSHFIVDDSHKLARSLDAGQVSDTLRHEFAIRGIELEDPKLIAGEPGGPWTIGFNENGESRTCPVAAAPAPDQIGGPGLSRLAIGCYSLWDDEGDWMFIGAMLLLFLYNLYFVNVNHTSIHSFYRDRLSRAYLFRTGKGEGIEFNDEQKLSTLNGRQSQAPYHLINAALNLQASKDLDLRGRKSDFFLFSKRFTGSERTGYCETTRMEERDRHLNLGTAAAISGAAATPNMGSLTISPLVFILTMLNVRLGYWLPHPRRSGSGLFSFAPGPAYLWREALGRMNETCPYVNVSDGGHIENLGLYQLLRRRCRRIIVVDAEADPDLRFESLVQLLRYARIDMGVEIDLDLQAIRPQGDGGSERHWATGTIRYGNDEAGELIYFKSTLTGDETADIRDYHLAHPTFPHESTADQFFNEAQFEAYRELGFHSANSFFQSTAADRKAGTAAAGARR